MLIKYVKFLALISILSLSQQSFASELVGCEPTTKPNNFTIFEIDDSRQRVTLKRERIETDKWFEYNEELIVTRFDEQKIFARSPKSTVLDTFAFSKDLDRNLFLERVILTGMAHYNIEDERNNRKWTVPYLLYSCKLISKLLPPQ